MNEQFYYVDLLLSGDTIRITGEFKDFPHNLSFEGTTLAMGYVEYIYQTREINKQIDSLNRVSSYVQDFFANPNKQHLRRSKIYSKEFLKQMKNAFNQYTAASFENEIEKRKNSSLVERDLARLRFIHDHPDIPVGQFLLTRIMHTLPINQLRDYYDEIPAEMRKNKFPKMVYDPINPTAGRFISEANRLLSKEGTEKELFAYTQEAFDLYKQGVYLDPERTDAMLAIGMLYERLLPLLGMEAYEVAIEYLELFIENETLAEGKSSAQKQIEEIRYRKQ